MSFLGIDYGERRIGIAVSDPEAMIAFPKTVLENGPDLVGKLREIIQEYGTETVVLGESKDFKGNDNPVMEGIRAFKRLLEDTFKVGVVFEPEFMTSVQAERQGATRMLDASAAALILQSYLDKKNKGSKAE